MSSANRSDTFISRRYALMSCNMCSIECLLYLFGFQSIPEAMILRMADEFLRRQSCLSADPPHQRELERRADANAIYSEPSVLSSKQPSYRHCGGNASTSTVYSIVHTIGSRVKLCAVDCGRALEAATHLGLFVVICSKESTMLSTVEASISPLMSIENPTAEPSQGTSPVTLAEPVGVT